MSSQTGEVVSIEGQLTQVVAALDAAFERARQEESDDAITSLDLSSDRYIIFSDLHRGTRNDADDFQRTE
jgi:C4-type Zn-finger protein